MSRSALDTLLARSQGRKDKHTLALAVEGGGMAGAVSAGMCVALEQLGLMRHFDLIVGSSAGALNGSYSACGQASLGATNYLDCASRDFFSRRRLLWGRPPMNLDYLFEGVMQGKPYRLPLKTPFICLAVDLDSHQPLALSGFRNPGQLSQAVRASCHMPALAGPPVVIEGRRLVDGGLLESIPYETALKAGASRVLVARSYSPSHRKSPYRRHERAIIKALRPEALTLVEERPERYNQQAAYLQSGIDRRISHIAPAADQCSSFENRPREIQQALAQGAAAALGALGQYGLSLRLMPLLGG